MSSNLPVYLKAAAMSSERQKAVYHSLRYPSKTLSFGSSAGAGSLYDRPMYTVDGCPGRPSTLGVVVFQPSAADIPNWGRVHEAVEGSNWNPSKQLVQVTSCPIESRVQLITFGAMKS